MDEPQNLIQKCIAAKIPFCVCIAHIDCKNIALDGAGKDYFLAAFVKDIVKAKVPYYKITTNQMIAEVTLNDNDYVFFKTINDDFVKVLHAAQGRVYEYKNAESLHKEFRKKIELIKKAKEKTKKILKKVNNKFAKKCIKIK